MEMTIDEFEEYAKAHDYVIFTRQQYEHVIDVFNNYELLSLDYYGRLKVDIVAMLDKIREQIKSNLRGVEITLEVLAETHPSRPKIEGAKDTLEECLEIIDKAEVEPHND